MSSKTSIAIGLGGTGAKCIESLIHICAAGLGPDRMDVFLVDPDYSSGEGVRARHVAETYAKCRGAVGPKSAASAFGAELRFHPVRVGVGTTWESLLEPSLSDFFAGSRAGGAKDFAELLYSQKDLSIPLEMGFKGHPSIGAPILATLASRSSPAGSIGDVVELLERRIRQGEDVEVFIFGSIFGATGAAGFPTIAKILRECSRELPGGDRVRIGGAMMLPYFSLSGIPSDTMRANTSEMLQHLSLMWRDPRGAPYDAVYVLGAESGQLRTELAIGGALQRSASHYVELLAAISSLDFVTHQHHDGSGGQHGEPGGFYTAGRADSRYLDWTDLPDGNALRRNLVQFVNTGLIYLGAIWPILRGSSKIRDRRLFRWLSTNFKLNDFRADDEVARQEELGRLMTESLRWIADLHQSANEDQVRLLRREVVAGINAKSYDLMCEQDLGRVEYGSGERRSTGAGDFTTFLDFLVHADPRVTGSVTGRLFDALFRAAGDYCAVTPRSLSPKQRPDGAVRSTVAFLPTPDSHMLSAASMHGSWESVGSGLLWQLARELRPDEQPSRDVLTAIPTPWARPLLFSEALMNEEHPLHAQVRDEWRGLLSVLCFSAYLGLDLSVHTVDLDAEAKNHTFARALLELAPPDAKEGKLAVIKLEGDVIGGTYPLTFVYTAPGTAKKLAQIPWTDQASGRLRDPVTALRGSTKYADYMHLLKKWVERLRDTVAAARLEALDTFTQNRLLVQLRLWNDEIPTTTAGLHSGFSAPHAELPPLVPGPVRVTERGKLGRTHTERHIIGGRAHGQRVTKTAALPRRGHLGVLSQGTRRLRKYDVFLCHNSRDNEAVERIAQRLLRRRIVPWLDLWEIRPGQTWQRELEKAISRIGCAAVFVGTNRRGPWQDAELESFINLFVRRRCSAVIPAILPDCTRTPKLPIFLQRFAWVDFRRKRPDPMERLVLGIVSSRPAKPRRRANPREQATRG